MRKSDVNPLNPTAQRLHVVTIPISAPSTALTVFPSNRVYFPHLPVIEVGQLVGLISFVATGLNSPFGEPQNISPDNIGPGSVKNLSTLGVLAGGMENVLITIVNKSGDVIFNQIPYASLFPIKGKIKPYNAVNIDSRNCYLSFPPFTDLIPNTVVNIGFLMQYQNTQ